MAHKFQINLRGIIDLLSKHLYSGPDVFVRELLQNGVDAIRARLDLDPHHPGEITFELHTPKGKLPTLIVTDNGVGLTEDEVHRFLATIGESSKRLSDGDRPTDFIGQFGVGLLSCFTVSEEIVVISRSAKTPDAPAVEWRGRPDGTYDVKTLDIDFAPGTQVCLTARSEQVELFAFKKLVDLGKRFGVLLPYPIKMTAGPRTEHINERGVPWRQEHTSEKQRQRQLLAYGKEAFGRVFLEAIPLKSKAGGVEGVAFVLPHEVSAGAKREDRVYLKNMLLSEKADNLLPDWAFFVKAVVNATTLKPTASRESFYEDETLDRAREELGECLRRYLFDLAERRPEQLRKFVDIHALALKALARDDDAFFRLIADVLPFQTNRGPMAFGDLRQVSDRLFVAPTVDQFRQVEKVAGAQGITVVNGGYTYDLELLMKAGDHFDGVTVEEIGAEGLVRELGEPSEEDADAAHGLLTAAAAAFRPFRCEPDLKKFAPAEVPVIYATTGDGQFFRSLEQSKEVADTLWSGVLESLGSGKSRPTADSRLTFNAANPLVRKLFGVTDRPALRRFCEMLYVQGLLMAHQPLSAAEMGLMNDGLIGLAEWGGAMKTPEQNTPEALRAYIYAVDRLEHGTARVAAAEVAVSRADELGDEDLRYKARECLMTAAVFSGRPDLATVHFGWMLARFDADPDRHSEAMLLWQYKWIVTRLPLFPQIPKAQILATFADMETRFRKYGQGEHALQKIRRTLCQNLGDDRGAAQAHRAFLKTRRDTLSDCAACVPSSNVYYYIGVNDDEKAFAEAVPILDGNLRCASVPHSTIAGLLLAYLRNGRGEEAMALHRRGYKLVERNPEHVDDAAKHMLFLALTGNHAAAIRLFERHAPVAAAGKDPLNGFYFNLRAHLTLILLLEAGRDTLKLRLPTDFPVAGDKGVYDTKALITWYLEAMTTTAKLFDARNENGAYMKLVRAFRRNKKHATPVPLRKGQ